MNRVPRPLPARGLSRSRGLATALRLPARGAALTALAALSALTAPPSFSQDFPEPLAIESTASVARIDTPYPKSYALVHDFAFGSLIDSAFSVVDTKTREFKGMLSGGNFATANWSAKRGEIYIGETFSSRGTRGKRSDLLSIYDMENLSLLKEVELPEKRAAIVVHKNAVAMTDSERFMLVFNLNPGTSVSVVDLDSREFVGEISTPGCSLIYPTQNHDFFMLCGDGSLLNLSLDNSGKEISRSRSEPFIDIDNDPLSEKASKVAGDWHFISFKGDVRPVKSAATGGAPEKLWSLTTEAERKANWRPAGWHWTAARDNNLWVGMTPNGYEGSHKDPNTEVWLFDTLKQQRTGRIKLNTMGLSIDVSLEEKPRLLVVNVEGSLDVYDAMSGEYLHSIHDLGASPYQVHRLH